MGSSWDSGSYKGSSLLSLVPLKIPSSWDLMEFFHAAFTAGLLIKNIDISFMDTFYRHKSIPLWNCFVTMSTIKII